MKKLLLLPVLCLLASSSFASDFGSNGSYSSSYSSDTRDLEARCQTALRELRSSREMAYVQFSKGNAAMARNILVNGLVKAHMKAADKALMKLLLSRAIDLNNVIGAGSLEDRVAVKFIAEFYDFIEENNNDFEVSYYKARTCMHFCGGFDADDFYDKLDNYAEKLIHFVLRNANGLGRDEIELNVYKFLISWVADDLNNSPDRRVYACQILDLQKLQEILEQNSAGFNSYELVGFMRNELDNVADRISHKSYCHR